MSKIVDYKILKSRFASELETDVKQHISNGWQPLGGVTYNVGSAWAQAVIKVEVT
jgi:hypothetical protein